VNIRTTLLAAAALTLPAGMAFAQSVNLTNPTPAQGSLSANVSTNAQVGVDPLAPTDPLAPAVPALPDAASETAVEATTQTEVTAPMAEAPAAAPTPATPATPGPVTAASQADIRTGVMVHDTSGAMVGTIESADASGAVVSTGSVRARLPLGSFGRNNQGLVIAMTRVQLEAAATAAAPTPTPS
jgi:hypothetical protein